LSFTLSVLVPPSNVGVAPTVAPVAPVPCWIVRLCASGEPLVNLIVTVPAVACSELVVNLSWPLGSAATASDPPAAPPVALAALEVLEALDAGAEVAVELAADDELLLEPPSPEADREDGRADQQR
jgi:hypothetical protein